MQFATWNVNSLKVRLPQVLEWLAANPGITALALQETKLEDHNFPAADFEAAGYHVAFIGQKTYNGVAIVSRLPLEAVHYNLPDFDDVQRRVIAATIGGVRFISVYVPNGQALDSEKYPYKMAWLEALNRWIAAQLQQYPQLIVAGDYNIAPEDRDVHDPAKWADGVLVSPPEREAFARLLALGLVDAFRQFEQEDKLFSWWDYRQFSFRRNAGLRIDHLLVSNALAPRLTACGIDKAPRKLDRPSDHTPVIACFS